MCLGKNLALYSKCVFPPFQKHYIVKNNRDTLGVRFVEPHQGLTMWVWIDAQHGAREHRFELMGYPLGRCINAYLN